MNTTLPHCRACSARGRVAISAQAFRHSRRQQTKREELHACCVITCLSAGGCARELLGMYRQHVALTSCTVRNGGARNSQDHRRRCLHCPPRRHRDNTHVLHIKRDRQVRKSVQAAGGGGGGGNTRPDAAQPGASRGWHQPGDRGRECGWPEQGGTPYGTMHMTALAPLFRPCVSVPRERPQAEPGGSHARGVAYHKHTQYHCREA